MAALIPMDSNDLLAVSPKLLAQAILHRRERLADLIPSDLEARKVELAEAEPLAKSAREDRDGINSKVAGLKSERNDAQKKANKAKKKQTGKLELYYSISSASRTFSSNFIPR